MTQPTTEKKKRNPVSIVADWLNSRFGLTYPVLRPAPRYAVSPLYWLGALTVVAFLIQGISGVIMMLYYVPSPSQAYPSTIFVLQEVNLGRFLETVHLYTAYAMIMLAFMHMMRGYFVSVYKKPREAMWVVGMLMGFVTLGFGLTGYLLPWTVVSKSATDVTIGMIDTLPPQLASFIGFLVAEAGGDATTLLRFYDLHVVVLPAVLLVLLTVKMYMLEVHGISAPSTKDPLSAEAKRLIPVFPDLTFYLLELAALFGAGMLLISAVFPLQLPPEYSAQLAAQYSPQPDWYFLWMYQILKISIFEGPGMPVALSLVTILLILLVVLPFIDKREERRIISRPGFVTLGVVFVAELFVLSYWGLVTPGQVIPVEQAVEILGGTALAVALISLGVFRFARRMVNRNVSISRNSHSSGRSAQSVTSLKFVTVLTLGAVSMGNLFNSIVWLVQSGLSMSGAGYIMISTVVLVLAALGAAHLMAKRRLDSEF
jgi:quinol-cytochrome oxidoreductase complex cytochrome b subunit